eukprot:1273997-Pyramimonas_sp.AAC.1
MRGSLPQTAARRWDIILADGSASEGLDKDELAHRGRALARDVSVKKVAPSPPFTRTRDAGVNWLTKSACLLEEMGRACAKRESPRF